MNTDFTRCIDSFEFLGSINTQQRLISEHGVKLLTAFERGDISAPQFRIKARSFCKIDHINDSSFDKAWNSMLLDIPIEHLDLIVQIKQHYKTYLISNTNAIHLEKLSI